MARRQRSSAVRILDAFTIEDLACVECSLPPSRNKPGRFKAVNQCPIAQVLTDTKLSFRGDPQAATFQVLRAAHKVEGMPVSLIVDKAGCELGIIQGPADWASADSKALMKAAIGRP
jgi:hypothetical protein